MSPEAAAAPRRAPDILPAVFRAMVRADASVRGADATAALEFMRSWDGSAPPNWWTAKMPLLLRNRDTEDRQIGAAARGWAALVSDLVTDLNAPGRWASGPMAQNALSKQQQARATILPLLPLLGPDATRDIVAAGPAAAVEAQADAMRAATRILKTSPLLSRSGPDAGVERQNTRRDDDGDFREQSDARRRLALDLVWSVNVAREWMFWRPHMAASSGVPLLRMIFTAMTAADPDAGPADRAAAKGAAAALAASSALGAEGQLDWLRLALVWRKLSCVRLQLRVAAYRALELYERDPALLRAFQLADAAERAAILQMDETVLPARARPGNLDCAVQFPGIAGLRDRATEYRARRFDSPRFDVQLGGGNASIDEEWGVRVGNGRGGKHIKVRADMTNNEIANQRRKQDILWGTSRYNPAPDSHIAPVATPAWEEPARGGEESEPGSDTARGGIRAERKGKESDPLLGPSEGPSWRTIGDRRNEQEAEAEEAEEEAEEGAEEAEEAEEGAEEEEEVAEGTAPVPGSQGAPRWRGVPGAALAGPIGLPPSGRPPGSLNFRGRRGLQRITPLVPGIEGAEAAADAAEGSVGPANGWEAMSIAEAAPVPGSQGALGWRSVPGAAWAGLSGAARATGQLVSDETQLNLVEASQAGVGVRNRLQAAAAAWKKRGADKKAERQSLLADRQRVDEREQLEAGATERARSRPPGRWITDKKDQFYRSVRALSAVLSADERRALEDKAEVAARLGGLFTEQEVIRLLDGWHGGPDLLESPRRIKALLVPVREYERSASMALRDYIGDIAQLSIGDIDVVHKALLGVKVAGAGAPAPAAPPPATAQAVLAVRAVPAVHQLRPDAPRFAAAEAAPETPRYAAPHAEIAAGIPAYPQNASTQDGGGAQRAPSRLGFGRAGGRAGGRAEESAAVLYVVALGLCAFRIASMLTDQHHCRASGAAAADAAKRAALTAARDGLLMLGGTGLLWCAGVVRDPRTAARLAAFAVSAALLSGAAQAAVALAGGGASRPHALAAAAGLGGVVTAAVLL